MGRDQGQGTSWGGWTARRASVVAALVSISAAVCASGAAASAKPGSSCAHPLKSGESLEGKLTGDTKVLRAIVQNDSIKSPSTTKADYRIQAEATNSRVVVCRAEIMSVPLLVKAPGPIPPGTPIAHHKVKLVIN